MAMRLPVIDLGGTADNTLSRTSDVAEVSDGESLRGALLKSSVEIKVLRDLLTSSTAPTL
jgi:hypothetical protein